MAHVHVPKPVHGWRAFFGEIAIIVIGVLIALGAEEAVTEWTWERKVGAGEVALRDELGGNYLDLIETVGTEPCIQAQIDSLRSRLIDRARPWEPAPLVSDATAVSVIRMPWRPLSDGEWHSLVSDGTATHFPNHEQAALVAYYSQLTLYVPVLEEARRIGDRMRVLADPIELNSSDRLQLLQSLAELSLQVHDSALVARQEAARTQSKGYAPPPATVSQFLARSGTEAYCARRGLPLGNWRAEVAKGRTELRS